MIFPLEIIDSIYKYSDDIDTKLALRKVFPNFRFPSSKLEFSVNFEFHKKYYESSFVGGRHRHVVSVIELSNDNMFRKKKYKLASGITRTGIIYFVVSLWHKDKGYTDAWQMINGDGRFIETYYYDTLIYAPH